MHREIATFARNMADGQNAIDRGNAIAGRSPQNCQAPPPPPRRQRPAAANQVRARGGNRRGGGAGGPQSSNASFMIRQTRPAWLHSFGRPGGLLFCHQFVNAAGTGVQVPRLALRSGGCAILRIVRGKERSGLRASRMFEPQDHPNDILYPGALRLVLTMRRLYACLQMGSSSTGCSKASAARSRNQ